MPELFSRKYGGGLVSREKRFPLNGRAVPFQGFTRRSQECHFTRQICHRCLLYRPAMRRIALTIGLLLALDCSVAYAQLRTQTIASGLGSIVGGAADPAQPGVLY